jgi:hypothetical protein
MDNTSRVEMCKKIKHDISNLNQNEIEEIFKIIYKNNNNYSKNNNGIFINLSWIDDNTLININNYIDFCIKSHNEINKYEVICNILNDSINNKDKTDEINIENINSDVVVKNTSNVNKNKISSYMKFYLLKKKFMKQNLASNVNKIENSLTHDEYVL